MQLKDHIKIYRECKKIKLITFVPFDLINLKFLYQYTKFPCSKYFW